VVIVSAPLVAENVSVLSAAALSYGVGTDEACAAQYGGGMSASNDLLHFVGSIPLDNSEAVLRGVSRVVGQYLRRIPDGETGERRKWIRVQQAMLMRHPAIEVDPTQPPLPVRQSDGTVLRHIELVRLKPTADPETVNFDTGYERPALESYATFVRLRDEGAIPPHLRFQVTLATPLATGFMYVSPVGRDRYLRAYERSLLKSLDHIIAAIPAQDLSIQFDVCQEVLMFEHYFPVVEPDYKRKVFDQLARLASATPDGVELGFHLCYGSPGDQPLVRLRDARVLVELMNGIAARVSRRVDFIHVPAPKGATDSFFAPLRDWRAPKDTRLYLGLLQEDDHAGNLARIASACTVVRDFGVAAECGFGRRDPSHVPAILAIHRDAAETLVR
jgi:hypothetical protein